MRRDAAGWFRLVRVAPWLGAIALALAGLSALFSMLTPLSGTLAALVFAAGIVRCVALDEQKASFAFLCSPPLRRIGALSYGIYLFHLFIVLRLCVPIRDLVGAHLFGFLVAFLVIGAASYAAAAVSFRWVEAPALTLKRRVPRP